MAAAGNMNMPRLHRSTQAVARLLLSLAGLLPALSSSAQLPLSPDQVAKLYLDFNLYGNTDSARNLSEYLKPLYAGKDVLQVDALTDPISAQTVQDAMREFEAKHFVANIFPNATQPQVLHEKLIEAYRIRDATYTKMSVCRVLSSSIVTHPAEPPSRVAKITFECIFPDSRYALKAAREKHPITNNQTAMLAMINDYIAGLRDPIRMETVTGTHDLYAAGPNGLWFASEIRGWLDRESPANSPPSKIPKAFSH